MDRKNFVKNSGLAAASFALWPGSSLSALSADQKVKIAIIGVGGRGQGHLELVLRRDDVEVVAICDIDEQMLIDSKKMIAKSGKKMPQIYTGDMYAW